MPQVPKSEVLLPVSAVPTVRQDRVTITFQLSHEHVGASPFSVAQSFATLLQQQEQPYHRRITLLDDGVPIPLDTGWINTPGMLVIDNKSGTGLQVNPSPEERERMANQVIRVLVNDIPCFVVRPGRFLFVELDRAAAPHIALQAEGGVVPCCVYVLPQ